MELPRSGRLAAVLWLTLAAGCGSGALVPVSEVELAERAADAWVREHPAAWAMAVTTTAVAERPEWTPSCTSPLTNGYVSLRVRSSQGDLELAFRCPIDERSTAEELQVHFVRAVPWNIAQGVNAPNWRFQAWLRESSVFDGVTFHTPVPGTLAVNIATPVSGLRGESTRRACAASVGAGSADGACALQRRHAIPMQVRFTFPADLSALR